MERVQDVLPYSRERYLDFLGDDFDGLAEWYGVSFQVVNEEISSKKASLGYENLFRKVVSTIHNSSFWIINHDDKDVKWFPNEEDNLADLRGLFKQANIPNTFKGALILTNDDLLISPIV